MRNIYICYECYKTRGRIRVFESEDDIKQHIKDMHGRKDITHIPVKVKVTRSGAAM